MLRKILAALFLISALMLVGVILIRKNHKEDEIKNDLQEGFAVNDFYSRETRKLWGDSPIELKNNPNLARVIRESIVFESSAGLETNVIAEIQAATLEFLAAYADGGYEAIIEYRLRQTDLVDPDYLAKQAARTAESLQILRKNVAAPLFSKPSKAESQRLVRISPELGQELGTFYTNRIKLALLNEIATKAYKNLGTKAIVKDSGQAILARINREVSFQLELIEDGQAPDGFTTPWEKMSSQLLNLRILNTNRLPNAFVLNTSQLSGLHRDTIGLFGYDPSPHEIAKERGDLTVAVFQTAIKPRGLDYFGPITAIFFLDPKDSTWRLHQFVCHSHISSSVPF